LFILATKSMSFYSDRKHQWWSEPDERALRRKGFQSLGRNRRYFAEDRTVIAARINRLIGIKITT
jgi:hypothetical protein